MTSGKYIITKDFEAIEYNRAKVQRGQVLLRKIFKKGTVLGGSVRGDGTNTILTISKVGGGTNGGIDASFDITNATVPYTGTLSYGIDEAFLSGGTNNLTPKPSNEGAIPQQRGEGVEAANERNAKIQEMRDKIAPIFPFVGVGAGVLFAYKKKLGIFGYVLCIAGGYVVGHATKNILETGNLIGWK